MLKFFFVTLLAGFLVGCGGNYQEREAQFKSDMDSWVGGNIGEIISRLGPPNNVYPILNGEAEVYTWAVSETYTGTRTALTGYNDYTGWQTAQQAYTAHAHCKLNITANTDDGVITRWSAQGNACF